MTPNPKKKRLKLSVDDYQALRKFACDRAMSHCEHCGQWCPLANGHLHHVISRGAGGGDLADNVLWLDYLCHHKKHMGLI